MQGRRFSLEFTSSSWLRQKYYYNMKSISMKVPPLNQLYEQKQGYQAHKKKLQRIMSERKSQLLDGGREGYAKRLLNNFQRKFNVRSLELARQNSKIIQKIQKAKPNISLKQQLIRPSQSRVSNIFRSKQRIIEQEKQNFRIRNKVQSMSSSLNSKAMDRDYRRSMQIRNRITHFKTQQNQKVMLKANRYLGKSASQNNSSCLLSKEKSLKKQSIPQLTDPHTFNKDIISIKMSKISANVASHYKKEQISKNRIVATNKLFKLARERRNKASTMLQKLSKDQNQQVCVKQQDLSVFPTELSKPVK